MSGPESKFKTKLVKQIKAEGGYARRLEDQFAVGIPDLIVVVPEFGLVAVEVKMTENRRTKYGASPRQVRELNDIDNAGGSSALLGVLIDETEMALGPGVTATTVCREMQRNDTETFIKFLTRYLNGGI